MSPELNSLIKLQDVETRSAAAQRRIADAPGEIAALDAKLSAARDALAAAKQAAAEHQAARRSLDNDLIAAQQRQSKYKEQLMAVKTNEEYHAMQHQIASAAAEVGRVEERVIVNMVEADEVAARVQAADAALKAADITITRERSAIEAEAAELKTVVEQTSRDRAELVPQLGRATRETFDRVLRARQGIAVAPTAAGHCSICNVRLRPQVYQTIIRNEEIVQCDSCQRILYFAGVRTSAETVQAALDAATTRQQDHDRR